MYPSGRVHPKCLLLTSSDKSASMRLCFSALFHHPVASQYAPRCLTQPLPKQDGNKVKQCCPLRKAFSAAFHVIHVKMPCGSDKTATKAANKVTSLTTAILYNS